MSHLLTRSFLIRPNSNYQPERPRPLAAHWQTRYWNSLWLNWLPKSSCCGPIAHTTSGYYRFLYFPILCKLSLQSFPKHGGCDSKSNLTCTAPTITHPDTWLEFLQLHMLLAPPPHPREQLNLNHVQGEGRSLGDFFL